MDLYRVTTSLLPLLLLLLSVGCIGDTFHISNASEFITFTKDVDAGITFEGTTVFIDNDISFLGKSLTPVGTRGQTFRGTFDGQGHTFSNVLISSSNREVGLFGAVYGGATIQNIILDSTCSVTSTYTSNENTTGTVGGVIGYCYSIYQDCIVRNSVNMGTVSFTGQIPNGSLVLGGISGRSLTYTISFRITNCVNTGDISDLGSSENAYIGGVTGTCEGISADLRCKTINCLNFGEISVIELNKASKIYAGGIFGYIGSYGDVSNCVNFGSITSNIGTASIGGCGGYSGGKSNAEYNFWSRSIGCNNLYGYGRFVTDNSSMFDANFNLVDTVTLDNYGQVSTLMEALNSFVNVHSKEEYSHWILNKENKEVSFVVGDRKIVTFTSKLILLPSLGSDGKLWFDGWYTNKECTTPLNSFLVNTDKSFYGKWEENKNTYTITFHTDGGLSVDPISAQFGTVVNLQKIDTSKDGYDISRWEDDEGNAVSWSYEVPSRNTELFAVWVRTRISTPSEMAEFFQDIMSGKGSFLTVTLESDLDFDDYEGKYGVIGIYSPTIDISFKGTFDGQGHTISNLGITSSNQHTGVFGYAPFGATIKNLIIDSSCYITNTFSLGSYMAYTGGIIGYCLAKSMDCTVENCINMGEVTFSGSSTATDYYPTVGGIMGTFYFGVYGGYIKNCVNYGNILATGKNSGVTLGGILGDGYGNMFINNCINGGYVMTTQKNTVATEIGGIVGFIVASKIENCVNVGSVSTADLSKSDLGYIAAGLFSTYMYNCYGTKKYNYPLYGSKSGSVIERSTTFDSSTFELSSTIVAGSYSGTSLIAALNAWAEMGVLSGYSGWLLNKKNKEINFTVGNKLILSTKSEIILLPSISKVDDDIFFDSWYTDPEMKSTLGSYEVTQSMTLYGGWVDKNTRDPFTLFFNTTGGTSIQELNCWYSDVINLPRMTTKEGYIFVRWEDEYGNAAQWLFTMPKRNITLYAVWVPLMINTPDDFENLAFAVSNKETFFGKTVYLCNDLDLSNVSMPIGTDTTLSFQGTFDGQGYTISGFTMTSNSQRVALFTGSTDGLTLINLVLDASCSLTSTFSESKIGIIGGIVGSCESDSSQCLIENCVNMANVTFTGETNDHTIIAGGVIGQLISSNYESTIRNCVNYGSIFNKGSGLNGYVGGVVARFSGKGYTGSMVQSCLNYGTISHTGDISYRIFIGGVLGYAMYANIEGCVNMGDVSAPTTQIVGETKIIGAIGGGLWNGAVSNSYWPESSDLDVFCIEEESADCMSFDDNFTLKSGTSVIVALNSYADSMKEFSRWYLNTNKNNVTLRINERDIITYSSQIILAPGLARSGKMSFDGWTSQQVISDYEITEKTTLEGLWDDRNYGKQFTISFNTGPGGEYIAPVTADYGTKIELRRNVTREGRIFMNWANSNGAAVPWSFTIPGKNMELYAAWKVLVINNEEDFIDFMSSVNTHRYNYSEHTIIMESDINVTNYTSSLSPIGYSITNFFTGTFDGQGYVISGFKVESSYQTVGLFGYSGVGATFRNIVLDSSCSFTSTYKEVNSYKAFVGGIIGLCTAIGRECIIEKCVNMGSISSKGSSGSIVGGIVGYYNAEFYNCRLDSSVNYGTITVTGCGKNSFIGGLIGTCEVSGDSTHCNITGSVNNGVITHLGAVGVETDIGGVAGFIYEGTYIKTCVNTGNITVASRKQTDFINIGDIVGVSDGAYITNCYWSESTQYNLCGYYRSSYIYDNYQFNDDFVVNNNKDTLLSDLLYSLGVKTCTTITFNSTGGNSVPPLIIFYGSKNFALPTPINGGKMLIGWYYDPGYTKPFDKAEMEEGGSILLYARWTSYDVSYNVVTVYVQLVTRDLSKDEVDTVIKKVVDCDDCYTIEEFHDYGSESFTIIKFVDTDTSSEFVRVIKDDYSSIDVVYIVRVQESMASTKLLPSILMRTLITFVV